MNLGANIKRVRKGAGVTPSALTLAKICKELGASADEILELK